MITKRNFRIDERRGGVVVTTEEKTEHSSLIAENFYTYEKFHDIFTNTSQNLKKMQNDLEETNLMIKQVPKEYNLEPRLVKLKEDMEKVGKFIDAENNKNKWKGLEEQKSILETAVALAQQDIKDIKNIMEQLKAKGVI
jgi:hypothetical protein